MPLGRRDGLNFATIEVTLANTKNFDPTDVVALSGGHTIGIGHCNAFTNRLYPTQDPTMDETLATELKEICPSCKFHKHCCDGCWVPNLFDNKYYVNLVNRKGLFTSDQDLYTDSRTRDVVSSADDENLFFEKFVLSMIKMGQLNVLTGTQGEIRANCSSRNQDISYSSTLEEDQERAAEL